MLELVGPERHVVQGVLFVAKNDDVDQGHGLGVGVLQHGAACASFHLVAHLVQGGVQNLAVIVGQQLHLDVQRDALGAGFGGIARLDQPLFQGRGGDAGDFLVDDLGVGYAQAAHQADFDFAGGALKGVGSWGETR
ncbi:hypothetical protein D9M71_387430 [compost metagenome]